VVTRARAALALATTTLTAIGVFACNAILGNDDGVYVAGDAGLLADAGGPTDAPLDVASDASPDACSLDLQTDDHHCGRCDHDCLGGGCAGGACQPTTLAAKKNAPLGIALDDVALYFTTAGGFDAGAGDASPFLDDTVERCTLPSCTGGSQALASNQAYPVGLAAIGGVVYWTNTLSATVSSCARDGCGGAPTVMTANAGASAWELTGDATGIYWTNEGGDVRACTTTTCGSFPTLLRTGATPTAIARGAGSLLFVTERGTGPNFVDGAVSRGQTTSGPGTRIASGLQSVNGIAADAANVYFVTSGDGSVWKCPLATGCIGANASSLVLLANAQNTPWRIAVDATDVYWTNKGDGSVMRCKISGCANKPALVAVGKPGAWGIALDARFVYWTATGTVGARDGTVMKVAK
jgi:hypothetical protein